MSNIELVKQILETTPAEKHQKVWDAVEEYARIFETFNEATVRTFVRNCLGGK